MPLNEFWYGDLRLLNAYQKAYIADTSYKSWLIGYYNEIAEEVSMNNAFNNKKIEFPKWENPVEKIYKKQISGETQEQLGRKQNLDLAKGFSQFLNSGGGRNGV